MMFRWCLVLISCTVLAHQVNGAAIPIWELLSHEEKMGRLFYVFVHLVKQYCKTSDIPDCQKVLTLYGMSNLVSEDEHSLDIMDPYQRDAKIIVWEKIMRGEFKLPIKSSSSAKKQHDEQAIHNEVYSTPYEVRVRPPANFVAPAVSGAENELKSSPSSASQSQDLSENIKESSGTVILRLGRSTSDVNSDSVVSIPDHEAELLKRLAL